MKQRKRLANLENAIAPPPKMLPVYLYRCTVDGETMNLEMMEALTRSAFDGQKVEIGPRAGIAYYIPEATPEEVKERHRELQSYFEEKERELAEDPDKWKRDAEEIKRLAPLRREDRHAGKDPSKEHPYTWELERSETH